MAQKKFQDLDLTDAFLFAAVLQNEEICHDLLELLLGKKVGKVRVNVEHAVLYSSDYRSIRLDVYASDEQAADYDLEMQGSDKGNLPKRSRYYQAQMDMHVLKPGQDFEELRSNTIIFICTFDPFGRGRYRYSFENRCLEESDLALGDGTKKIFLNTEGTNPEEVPRELVNFLAYTKNSTGICAEQRQDAFLDKLHQHVTDLKQSRQWERRYMTFGEMLDNKLEEGRAEGRAEEQARMLKLLQRMQEHGQMHLVERLSDPAFLQDMYEEYQI